MISIIVPAYNGQKRIGPTLEKIITYADKHLKPYEILVIDDGSIDKTRQIVQTFSKVKVFSFTSNRGKGYAVKFGIEHARYSSILFTDSDLATPIEEIEKLMRFNKKFDVVIASRNLKDSRLPKKQPWYRQMAGKTFPLLVRFLVLPGIKDTQCGFKLFKTSIAKKLVEKQTFNGFAFDVELLFIAKKLGHTVKEVPVTWIDQPGSKVHLVKDSIIMFFSVLKIRINEIFGKSSFLRFIRRNRSTLFQTRLKIIDDGSHYLADELEILSGNFLVCDRNGLIRMVFKVW